ncbi:MAG: ABC transporter substrate-binding protein [Chloroflexi bacterium]|nr:ABC transporter substrate-binding protein [Chloroflexota bacterium]
MTEDNYWSRALAGRVTRRAVIRGTGVAGAGIVGAALIGCGGGDEEPAPAAKATAPPKAAATGTPDPFAGVKRGGTIKFTATGDPPTLDPYGNLSFLTKGFAAYVYSRMYKIGARPDLNPNSALPEPDLASAAESKDGQSWVVKIRPGAKHHNVAPVNGREVTADDVLFSWKRLTGKDSPNAAQVKNVVKVEAVDKSTLKFDLDAPTATFLDMLADANLLWVMPTESEGKFDPTKTGIGSGPWILDGYQPSQAFRFKKHPDFFVPGRPFVDGVQMSIVPEYANRLAQFQAGNTHVEGIQAEDVLTLRKDQPKVQWRGVQPALLSFIFFSPKDKDPNAPWQDARFRQAVSMATDRNALTELGYSVKALRAAGLDVLDTWNNLIPAGFTRWWLDPKSKDQGATAKFFEFNRAEAKKLLDAMGATGSAFKYQYTANRYGNTFNAIAEAIGNYILEAGLKPTTEVQDYSSKYITQTFTGNFNGVAFGYETPFPEVGGYFPRMFGDDPANHTKLRDAKITDLDKKQAVELDEKKRREFIWEIQRINAEQMYYVPSQAGAGTGWTAYRPEVRGIVQTRGYGGPVESLIHYWIDA